MDKEVVDALSVYIKERERIRMCAATGTEYQTKHFALRQYRFTNIRRRDDKATKWFVDNVYSSPRMVNPWLTAAMCRFLNWPPTVKHLIANEALFYDHTNFDAERIVDLLQGWQDRGNKLITGAYVILLGHRPAGKVRDVVYTARDMCDNWEGLYDAIATNSLEMMSHEFARQNGIGPFTAGQLVADLRLMPGVLDKAEDTYTYAPLGPGSQRGLNWVYGFDIKHKWKQQDFNDALRDVMKKIVIPNLQYLKPEELSLHSVQNIMCETSKLMKVLNGTGRPRAGYKTHEGLY